MPFSRRFPLALFLLLLPGMVLAQETTMDVTVVRGVVDSRPFTAVYPPTFSAVEDDSDVTVLSIQHGSAPLRCDVLVADGQPEGWSAQKALAAFDTLAIEAGWSGEFPGFRVSERKLIDFRSGPALYYRGEAQRSPLGFPVTVAHAEATDSGRTYVYECIMAQSIAADALPTVDFLIANFSTRSDAECCVAPPRP